MQLSILPTEHCVVPTKIKIRFSNALHLEHDQQLTDDGDSHLPKYQKHIEVDSNLPLVSPCIPYAEVWVSL